MSNQQILEAAITKAIDGGWSHELQWIFDMRYFSDATLTWDYWSDKYSVPELIFSHDFAKALWGNAFIDHQEVDNDGLVWNFSSPAWAYHLQQMVIAEDPIQYLGENM